MEMLEDVSVWAPTCSATTGGCRTVLVQQVSIRRRDYQFRCVWRRQGDKRDRLRIFNSAAAAYKFVIRMCGECPWQGSNRIMLRQGWAILAQRLQLKTVDVFHNSAREASLALQQANAKILWLRIETRQVARWNEMVEPMEVLKPKAWDSIAARAEAYCDALDAHSEKRWIPSAEAKS